MAVAVDLLLGCSRRLLGVGKIEVPSICNEEEEGRGGEAEERVEEVAVRIQHRDLMFCRHMLLVEEVGVAMPVEPHSKSNKLEFNLVLKSIVSSGKKD